VDPVTLREARMDCMALVDEGRFADTDQHEVSIRSDQVVWISEDQGTIWETRKRSSHGLHAVLRMLRAMPLELQAHAGDTPSSWLGFCSMNGAETSTTTKADGLNDMRVNSAGDLGVPRKAQVGRYTAAGRAVPPNPSNDGTFATNDEAASKAIVRATGGARYTAHRDGTASIGSQLVLMLTNPSVTMRECTMIVYLTEEASYPKNNESAGSTKSPSYRVVPTTECPSSLQPGALVLYIGTQPNDAVGSSATQVVEVLPAGGRAVLFDSRTVLHEVRPVTRTDVERLAVTVWVGGAYDLAGMGRHLFALGCGLLPTRARAEDDAQL